MDGQHRGLDGGRPRPDADTATTHGGRDDQRLITEGILLVSMGGSPRVTITGLADAEQVLEASRALAAARGVRLIPLETTGGAGSDVRIEPLDLPSIATMDEPAGIDRAIRALRLVLGGQVD